MDPVVTLAYAISLKTGYVTASAVTEVRRIAAGEYRTAYSAGGKVVASGTINGESVSFAVDGVFNSAGLLELCRVTEREIKDLTDAEFEDFCFRESINGVRPNFGSLAV